MSHELEYPDKYPVYHDWQTNRKLQPHEVILNYTQKRDMYIMAKLDAVTAAVKAAEERLDAVVTTVSNLKATIAALQDQIANLPPDDSADLQALADELNGHVAAFDAALNPPTE